LAELEGPRRRGIVEAIKVARAHGDLSENFEDHAAKNEQSLLERWIATLRHRLDDPQIVEGAAAEVVGFGSQSEASRGETTDRRRAAPLFPVLASADPWRLCCSTFGFWGS
jgi:transcription elongation factor GreA